jgi:hypothetical protein
MKTETPEYYEKIYIKSESNLPKKYQRLITHFKYKDDVVQWVYESPYDKDEIEVILGRFDWYFLPVPSVAMPNNKQSESALNEYAKKCNENFTKPSGIAQGWRACYEWALSQIPAIDKDAVIEKYKELVNHLKEGFEMASPVHTVADWYCECQRIEKELSELQSLKERER